MSVRLTAVTAVLLTQVGCLEGFASLTTAVRYDPSAQRFQVERELHGVGGTFFGCFDVEGCVEAIERVVTLASSSSDRAMADRLAQRLVESGAEQVRIEFVQRGQALDVDVRYEAPVGSRAATDTRVQPEWAGRPGKESYRLVVDAEASMGEPPRGVELRRAPVDAEGTWRTSWVYDPRVRAVDWVMQVGEEEQILAEIPGLAEALRAEGLLSDPVAPEPAPEPEPRPEPQARPQPARPEPAPRPEPEARPEQVAERRKERPERERSAPEVPQPVGGVFTYPPKIEGAMPAEVGEAAGQALLTGFSACRTAREAAGVPLDGYLFADAVVRADGWILSTSLYGEIEDPELLRCLAVHVDGWAFGPWGQASGATAYVSVPFAFRPAVAAGSPRKGAAR